MAGSRRRNDGRAGDAKARGKVWTPSLGRERRAPAPAPAGSEWLWGWHAVSAALANPRRGPPRVLVATPERARQLAALAPPRAPEVMDARDIGRLLPAGAAHQGVALQAGALAPAPLEEVARPADGVLVMLDQVTDPQNVGAIFRSAAAFGARGVILQDRHAPPISGALAKAAAGALDATPHVRVVNLARALDHLADLGWRAIGLASDAPDALAAVLDPRPTVLVLGSEGEGLRRLVREHCDALARIPMAGALPSLNVAAAAAIALHEATRTR